MLRGRETERAVVVGKLAHKLLKIGRRNHGRGQRPMATDTISIDAILGAPGAESQAAPSRRLLVEADIVIGVDVASRREFTVFGTPPLEATAPSGAEQGLRMLRVTLDQLRGQLDQLAALVKILKGTGGSAGD